VFWSWISRMIEGGFPFVTEEWIKSAYANSAKLAGDKSEYGLEILLWSFQSKPRRDKINQACREREEREFRSGQTTRLARVYVDGRIYSWVSP
jgi:hypothetical protein